MMHEPDITTWFRRPEVQATNIDVKEGPPFEINVLMSEGPVQGGVKHDGGKDPWHLMPWDAVRGITKVLAFGAKKYAPRNWENGMEWSRCYSALMRHMTAWWEGEKFDEDTGYSHLWHAGCCIIFLIAYEIRGVGKDDRPERAGGVVSPRQPVPGEYEGLKGVAQ